MFDTVCGFGQGTDSEQLGDYPGDADYEWESCCHDLSSDCSLGAGNAVGGTYPGSDYLGCDVDTIKQHIEVQNVGALTPGPSPTVTATAANSPTITPTLTPTSTGPTPTPAPAPAASAVGYAALIGAATLLLYAARRRSAS